MNQICVNQIASPGYTSRTQYAVRRMTGGAVTYMIAERRCLPVLCVLRVLWSACRLQVQHQWVPPRSWCDTTALYTATGACMCVHVTGQLQLQMPTYCWESMPEQRVLVIGSRRGPALCCVGVAFATLRSAEVPALYHEGCEVIAWLFPAAGPCVRRPGRSFNSLITGVAAECHMAKVCPSI